MNKFKEKLHQRSKEEEEELQQSRDTYHNKQHKINIDSSSNELQVSRQRADHIFKRQEYSLHQMREDLREKSSMF